MLGCSSALDRAASRRGAPGKLAPLRPSVRGSGVCRSTILTHTSVPCQRPRKALQGRAGNHVSLQATATLSQHRTPGGAGHGVTDAVLHVAGMQGLMAGGTGRSHFSQPPAPHLPNPPAPSKDPSCTASMLLGRSRPMGLMPPGLAGEASEPHVLPMLVVPIGPAGVCSTTNQRRASSPWPLPPLLPPLPPPPPPLLPPSLLGGGGTMGMLMAGSSGRNSGLAAGVNVAMKRPPPSSTVSGLLEAPAAVGSGPALLPVAVGRGSRPMDAVKGCRAHRAACISAGVKPPAGRPNRSHSSEPDTCCWPSPVMRVNAELA